MTRPRHGRHRAEPARRRRLGRPDRPPPQGPAIVTTARWSTPLLAIAVPCCLAAGVALIISGSRSHPPEAAPVPVAQFAIKPSVLGKLSPLRQGKVTVSGTVPGQPGKRCSITIASSRLVIASLCLDGPIVPTYQQPDGALAIPYDVHKIGMWNRGAQLSGPGGKPLGNGTTLLAGHINYIGQGTGTLYNLYEVRPGAIAFASDASGHLTRWQVTRLAVVVKAELPSWVFAGPAGPRRLVIVTCGGPIQYTPGYGYSYRDNVIAVAVPA